MDDCQSIYDTFGWWFKKTEHTNQFFQWKDESCQ